MVLIVDVVDVYLMQPDLLHVKLITYRFTFIGDMCK